MANYIKYIDKIEEGSILGKTIYDELGRELLSNGTILTKHKIDKIKDVGVEYVHIENKKVDLQTLKNSRRFYESSEETKELTKEIYQDILEESNINIKKYKEVIEGIFDDILSKDGIILNLNNLKSFDDYLFEHAINSTVLAVATCLILGLNRKLIENIAIGTIIHDIGYMALPDELLHKKNLSDEEVTLVNNHVKIGFEMIKEHNELSQVTLDAIKYHHENVDGSGYPDGLKGTEIPVSAKICSICDIYDSLLSNMPNKKKENRYNASAELIKSIGVKFDKFIAKNFLKVVGHYPKGTNVILSNGYHAEIVEENNFEPKVRLVCTNEGETIREDQYIDLSKSDIGIFDIDYKKKF